MCALRARTYIPKVRETEQKWHLVDASDQVLGRMASRVAAVLRGKHRPEFTPHLDLGDHVVIVPKGEPLREEIAAWLRARGAHEVATVLGELRVPVSKEDLAELTSRFTEATWQVRPPNLDDLFIALARRNGRFQ